MAKIEKNKKFFFFWYIVKSFGEKKELKRGAKALGILILIVIFFLFYLSLITRSRQK